MEFKITPGEYYVSRSGFFVRTQPDGLFLAEVFGRTDEERNANANAIAALPDLLEAAEYARKGLLNLVELYGLEDTKAIEKLSAALKLARDGREPKP